MSCRGGIALAAALLAAVPKPSAALERTGYVMGTMLSVAVEAPDSLLSGLALDSAFAIANRLDHLLSNYRPESELSRLAHQAPKPLKLSPLTFGFLSRTLAWSGLSQGALDPTVGPLVRAWGFDSEHPARPPAHVLDSVRKLCGFLNIAMDASDFVVALPAGYSLDPGATGKGYALAVMDSALLALGVTRWKADFGGQLYCRGDDSLLVPVRHPRSDTAALAWLRFARGSVATSGDYERYFEEEGRRFAHILDPRTGWPVQGRASVSVYAPDPLDADALSTTLFVLGPAAARPLLEVAQAGALFAEWSADSLVLIIVGAWPEAP